MDSILPKSLIPVEIVVVHSNLPLGKDRSFGYARLFVCLLCGVLHCVGAG
jgi:hypothetical protein